MKMIVGKINLFFVVLKMRIFQTRNQLKNYTNLLLENLKKKIHSSFIDNIWCADITDMQLISKFNKVFRFLLCLIYIFSKYTWFIPLKDKKGITITNAISMNLIVKYRQIKSAKLIIDQ